MDLNTKHSIPISKQLGAIYDNSKISLKISKMLGLENYLKI
jgi:hypothetical protein